MNLREEFDEMIKAIPPYHYQQPVYYCTQEHYDLLKENDLLKFFNGYKIVIVPALLYPEKYNEYWSKYEDQIQINL